MSLSEKLTVLSSCTVLALAVVFAAGSFTGFLWQALLTSLVLLLFAHTMVERIDRASKAEAAADKQPINVVFMEREGFPQ